MPKIKYDYQYTREELGEAVNQNISVVGTMKTLKAPMTSGTLRKKLTRLIQDYGIDTSHFLGMGWNKGLGANHKGGIKKKIIGPEDNRKCSKCGLIKLANEFYLRKKGPRVGDYYEKCKECMKSRGRAYYYKNSERQRYLSNLRRKRYVNERLALINKLKNNPCVDCGKIYPPWIMDFDHREGTIKKASISQAVHTNKLWKIEHIMVELEKCDLVCSNCHRNRTYLRIQKNKNAAVTKVVTVIA